MFVCFRQKSSYEYTCVTNYTSSSVNDSVQGKKVLSAKTVWDEAGGKEGRRRTVVGKGIATENRKNWFYLNMGG